MKNILLVTHSEDFFTIDKVAGALNERGAKPLRLNTDLFPGKLPLSSCLGSNTLCHVIGSGEDEITADRVTAVWLRKIRLPALDESLDPRYKNTCIQESRTALFGFLDGLWNARWIDPPDAAQAGENKLRQLRLGRDAGLRIPETLVTNHAARAQQFYRDMKGNVVAKLLSAVSCSMGQPDQFVYTSAVSEKDMEDAESLRHCPMVFQERIPVDGELRVIYVAGKCFTGEIRFTHTPGDQPDWRRKTGSDACWVEGEIPASVQSKIHLLMNTLGLCYGALDFIRTPSGEYIFLEVNPSGEWGMLEYHLGLPISAALADALLQNNG